MDPSSEIAEKARIKQRAVVKADVQILQGAIVNEDCTVGEGSKIGPLATLQDWVELANNVTVGNSAIVQRRTLVKALVVIGDGANIGMRSLILSDSRIGAFATIGKNVTIGKNSILGEYASVGFDSFLGDSVKLDEHVVVGTKVQIELSAWMHSYARADNLVVIKRWAVLGTSVIVRRSAVIGEDVSLGNSTVVYGEAVVNAGVETDTDVHIGPKAVIGEKSRLGKMVCVEMGIIVTAETVIEDRGRAYLDDYGKLKIDLVPLEANQRYTYDEESKKCILGSIRFVINILFSISTAFLPVFPKNSTKNK